MSMTSATPVKRRLLTPGVFVLLTLAAVGFFAAVYRFAFGLEAATNLDQSHPWGIWIAIDVSTGVALAAGGFTTAALAHIFHREHYEVITRPALLTAMLGYTFVAIGLLADLGRYYNIWHPLWPTMWQGNSVLFEVALCVTCYLTVLYIEFLPMVCERFMGDARWPRLGRLCERVKRIVDKTMFSFIIAGVILSCLHQSSLGNLMVLAPSKVHALWYTPILPLLFLLSAIAVGFPMVVVESLWASWALKLEAEMHVLSALAKHACVLLGLYLAVKTGDMLVRGSHHTIGDGSVQSIMFSIEMLCGLALPFIMLTFRSVRQNKRLLFLAALLIVFGVALNRINVFLISYQPHYATQSYFPSFVECVVTIGLISTLILVYRTIVTYFPVITHHEQADTA